MTIFSTDPGTHPQAKAIENVTKDILSYSNPDAIYCATNTIEGGPELLFSIFIEKESLPLKDTLETIISKTFATYPNFGYRLFWRNKAGIMSCDNLYIIRHCKPDNCIHSAEGSTFLDGITDLGRLLKRSKKHFRKAMAKAAIYSNDIDRSISKDDWGAAAYMLHKTFLLLFHTASKFIMGNGLVQKRRGTTAVHCRIRTITRQHI
ncbi:hypothetical protein [Flavobacterium sp. 3HN19-14]|uniref:hypothetical protein n=1 Tax=Flavobacterium sp. 3HN19-14 TaxID=3448133 RepID=UPI003EE39B69